MREAGFGGSPVAKLGAVPDPAIGEVGILEAIAAGECASSSTPRRRAPASSATRPRSGSPRRPKGILCLTAIETAIAAAEALDPAIAARISVVRSLGEWVPAPGVPRSPRRLEPSEPVGAGAPA